MRCWARLLVDTEPAGPSILDLAHLVWLQGADSAGYRLPPWRVQLGGWGSGSRRTAARLCRQFDSGSPPACGPSFVSAGAHAHAGGGFISLLGTLAEGYPPLYSTRSSQFFFRIAPHPSRVGSKLTHRRSRGTAPRPSGSAGCSPGCGVIHRHPTESDHRRSAPPARTGTGLDRGGSRPHTICSKRRQYDFTSLRCKMIQPLPLRSANR